MRWRCPYKKKATVSTAVLRRSLVGVTVVAALVMELVGCGVQASGTLKPVGTTKLPKPPPATAVSPQIVGAGNPATIVYRKVFSFHAGPVFMFVVGYGSNGGRFWNANLAMALFRYYPKQRTFPWVDLWHESNLRTVVPHPLGGPILSVSGSAARVFGVETSAPVTGDSWINNAAVIRIRSNGTVAERRFYDGGGGEGFSMAVNGDSISLSGTCEFGQYVYQADGQLRYQTCSEWSRSGADKAVYFTVNPSSGTVTASTSAVSVKVGTVIAFLGADIPTVTQLDAGNLAEYTDAWNGPPLNTAMADLVRGASRYAFDTVGTFHWLVCDYQFADSPCLAKRPTFTIHVHA